MTSPNSSSFPSGSGSSFASSAASSHTGLAEILQMCCTNNRSGQVTFVSSDSTGYVYIQHGHVLHAICGTVEGPEAVYRMLDWPAGSFTLDEDILPHQKTIDMTWEQLLFEGARRADALAAGESEFAAPVTSEPVTSTRSTKQNQPRLTLILPDQRPLIYNLEAEYTYLGRALGNEITLSDASVSNRHCMFIISGNDIFLRDLNSSNGTLVNGQSITETILQPGDSIQVGAVQIKFEPGVKRPKLTQSSAPASYGGSELSSTIPRTDSRSTIKISVPLFRNTAPLPKVEVKEDSAFVKGESPISYDNLPKPEPTRKKGSIARLAVGVAFMILLILGGAYVYFVVLAR